MEHESKGKQAAEQGKEADPTGATHTETAGEHALAKLLAKSNGKTPKPREIVQVIDDHPRDAQAVLFVVQQTFGNAYTAEVQDELDSLRIDWENGNLNYGVAGDVEGGYFNAGVGAKGVSWSTAGGMHTGKAGPGGMTMRDNLVGDTWLRTSAGDKNEVAVERGQGKNAETYVAAGVDGSGDVVVHGAPKVGDGTLAYSAEVSPDGDRGKGSVAYTENGRTSGGSVSASDKSVTVGSSEKTADGEHTGTATYSQVGAGGTLVTSEKVKGPGGEMSITSSGGMSGSSVEVAGKKKTGENEDVSGAVKVGTDGDVSARVGVRDGKESAGLRYDHTKDGDKLGGEVKVPAGDGTAGGRLAVGTKGDHATVEGGVEYTDKKGSFKASGSYQAEDEYSADVSAAYRPVPGLTIGGHAGISQIGESALSMAPMSMPVNPATAETGPTATFSLTETYANKKVAQNAGVSATVYPDSGHYEASMSAGVTGQVAPNVYLGAEAKETVVNKVRCTTPPSIGTGGMGPLWPKPVAKDEVCAEESSQVFEMASALIFTPIEYAALKLANIVNSNGELEFRLQADIFKKALEGAADVALGRKQSILSMFMAYTHKADPGMLNERMGAPTEDVSKKVNGQDSISTGVRVNF